MIAINAISCKEIKINTYTDLDRFLNKFNNKEEIKDAFHKLFIKGETIYWAFNPYEVAVNQTNEIMYSKDKNIVYSNFYDLDEAI